MNRESESPFIGKKALVYDKSLAVLGGGQREVFAFAKALSIIGFETEVVTSTAPSPSPEQIALAFGDEFEEVSVRYIEKSIEQTLNEEQPYLFFNQSHMHFVRNTAPVGIYRQMFPVRPVRRENAAETVDVLQSYSMILSNSSFTKKYTDSTWDYPVEKSKVILPPLAMRAESQARKFMSTPPVKEKKFFSLGRFTEVKNQKLLIEAFLEARSRYAELHEWQLVVMGVKHHDAEAEQYFAECQQLAAISKGAVSIEANVSYDRLEQHMVSSFGFVHAMGAFHLPGHKPHLCEHYGLCTVEAMAHGAIPLVYARSGVFDVLDVGKAGVPFISREGLVDGFQEVTSLWDSEQLYDMQKNLMQMALKTAFSEFTECLRRIVIGEVENQNHESR